MGFLLRSETRKSILKAYDTGGISRRHEKPLNRAGNPALLPDAGERLLKKKFDASFDSLCQHTSPCLAVD